MALMTGGTNRLTVNSSGNVGIGTTSPNNTIQVANLIDFNNTDYNTKLGYQAGLNIVSGAQSNVFVGYKAGLSSVAESTNAADNNTGIGYMALRDNKTGAGNLALGTSALTANTTGNNNAAIGFNALITNTTGSQNSAIGGYALRYNTTGTNNSAIGYAALRSNTEGVGNAAQNDGALYSNTTGSYNIATGKDAGYYSQTGSGNIFIGCRSGGYGTGAEFTGADYNTIIGYQAGYNLGQDDDKNVYIGKEAGYSETGSQKLYIADGNNRSIIYGDMSTGAVGIGGTVAHTTPYITVLAGGNVGIGTTSPQQKLEINGGIRLNTATAKPTCAAGIRGTLWYVQGGAGVADTVEACTKDAGDAYDWRALY
jgi:hypothetical protein